MRFSATALVVLIAAAYMLHLAIVGCSPFNTSGAGSESSSLLIGKADGPAVRLELGPGPVLLSHLPPPSEVNRSSSAGASALLSGSAYGDTLPHNRVARDGDYAVFSPAWDRMADASPEMLAYATYSFTLEGSLDSRVIGLGWQEPRPPAESVWLCLGNWDRDCWEWFVGPEDSGLLLESLAPYVSDGGECLLLVLATGTDSCTLAQAEVTGLNWTHTWGGGESEEAFSTAVDSDGNVLVAGTTTSYGAGGSDVLLMRYSPAGALQWAKTWGGSDDDSASALVLDDEGNIYLAGTTQSFGAGSADVLLLNYNPAGALQWARTWGGEDGDGASAIAMDSAGNLLVAGSSDSFNAAQMQELLLVKFSGTGSAQWARTCDWLTPAGVTGVMGAGVAVDGSDNVYTVGPVFPNEALMFGGYLLAEFDAEGSLLDHAMGQLTMSTLDVRALAMDNAGNLYMAGAATTLDGEVVYLAEVDLANEYVVTWWEAWCSGGSHSADEQVNALAFDADSNAILAGYSYTDGVSGGPLLLKYDFTAELFSGLVWAGDSDSAANAVALAPDGSVVLTGYAPDVSNAWQAASGTADITFDPFTSQGDISEPAAADAADAVGQESEPSGIEDIGGGGSDLLVIRTEL